MRGRGCLTAERGVGLCEHQRVSRLWDVHPSRKVVWCCEARDARTVNDARHLIRKAAVVYARHCTLHSTSLSMHITCGMCVRCFDPIVKSKFFPPPHSSLPMPFVQVSQDVRIYYHVYSSKCTNSVEREGDNGISSSSDGQPRRILFIMGLGASFVCWKPQIFSLLERSRRDSVDVELCTLDNRGLGLSSAPPASSANYSTECAHHTHINTRTPHNFPQDYGQRLPCSDGRLGMAHCARCWA